jgi:hypothetical protein
MSWDISDSCMSWLSWQLTLFILLKRWLTSVICDLRVVDFNLNIIQGLRIDRLRWYLNVYVQCDNPSLHELKLLNLIIRLYSDDITIWIGRPKVHLLIVLLPFLISQRSFPRNYNDIWTWFRISEYFLEILGFYISTWSVTGDSGVVENTHRDILESQEFYANRFIFH